MGLFGDHIPSCPNPSAYSGLPSDQDDWTCQDMKTYYRRCQDLFGKTLALEYVNRDIDSMSFFAEFHNCRFDCAFYKWAVSEGWIIESSPFSSVKCGTEGITEGVENIGKSVSILTHPVVLVPASIAVLYFFLKSYRVI